MITSSFLNFSLNIDYFSDFLFFTTRVPSKCSVFVLKWRLIVSSGFKKSASTSCVFNRFCPRTQKG